MKRNFFISLCMILAVAWMQVQEVRAQNTTVEIEGISAETLAEAQQLAEGAKELGILNGDETSEEINDIGIIYYKGEYIPQNYNKALRLFALAALKGCTQAQFNIGQCYSKGYGVNPNYTKAVEWYSKAAEQGLAEAQYNLGLCYYNGEGVLLDHSKAIKLWEKAAEQGNEYAQFNLGLCYEKGVSKDYNKAAEWYRKAAAHGNCRAKEALERLGR